MSASLPGGEHGTAASTTPPLRQRISTTLNDDYYWVTLSEPSDYDGNRQIILTRDQNDAAIVEFTAAPSTDAPDAFYVEFVEIRDTEPGLMRPRIAPTALPTELGTIPYPTAVGRPCPLSWVKAPTTADPDIYTLHIAEEPAQTVFISHAAGFSLKRPPYLLISPAVPTDYPAAEFVTETVCTECGGTWTQHHTHVCSFCRAHKADQEYIAKHGTPPMRPCNCCGEPTPYGGFCSQACRWDMEGCDDDGR
jgi:hypothetical protein